MAASIFGDPMNQNLQMESLDRISLPAVGSAPTSVSIPVTQYVRQGTNFSCGPTVLKMALDTLCKHNFCLDYLSALLGTTEEGTPNAGFERLIGYFRGELELEAHAKENATHDDLHQLLNQNWLVTINFLHPHDGIGHFALLHSLSAREVALVDPISGPDYRIPLDKFVWRGEEGSRCWLLALRSRRSS